MKLSALVVSLGALFVLAGAARAAPAFPEIEAAKQAVKLAGSHVVKAQKAHEKTGTLGGHASKALGHLKAALDELEAAEKFAAEHATKK
jgi:hypothetical protein